MKYMRWFGVIKLYQFLYGGSLSSIVLRPALVGPLLCSSPC